LEELQPAVERVRSFVETYGLYRKLPIEEIFDGLEEAVKVGGPFRFSMVSPRVALLECPVCQREQTFDSRTRVYGSADAGARSFVTPNVGSVGRASSPGLQAESPDPPGFTEPRKPLDSPLAEREVYHINMQCTYCMEARYECWIEVRPDLGWIRKVGQVPRPATAVPKEVSKALGEDMDLYRRARECQAESFGIGACAYLRRLLENQVNPLLELLLEVRRSEGAEQEELDEIEQALSNFAFDEKAKILYRSTPASLRFEGDNPIKLIHKRLSEGVHSMSEDQCSEVAAESMRLLEHLIRELSREHERIRARDRLSEDVRKLREMEGPH
jgi:hypothetical protein